MKIVVCRVDELASGERKIVEAGNRSIGVFRVGDQFYALANSCPHQGGPLCLGRIKPWVHADAPGQAENQGEDALVACPWHGWEYELSTGQSFLGPSEPPARGYGVSVTAGSEISENAVPATSSNRTPGPYVADTFEVHIDEEYIIVDTSPRARPRPEKSSRRSEGVCTS